MPAISGGMAAPALVNGAPTSCPRCGSPVPPGHVSCMHCGYQFSNLPAMPSNFVPPTVGDQVGPGILPTIAFLAALTVVGAPVALVLGLMSLSVIRRRGGTVRDRALSKWSVGLGFLWIVLGSVFITGAVMKRQKEDRIGNALANEAQAIEALKNLACAHKYARTIEFDKYSNLSALTNLESQFFDDELADGEAYGYHFIVREASQEHFVAVAEPIRYGETGLRSFSIDEGGQVRGIDTEGERLAKSSVNLPVLQDSESAYYKKDEAMANDVWRYVESLPNNPDPATREKILRIIKRLRDEYPRTQVVLQLKGQMEAAGREMVELQAHTVYLEAQQALTEGKQELALSKLSEIMSVYPGFTKIADVEKELDQLRARVAERKEQEAQALFAEAEALEREGKPQSEVRRLYQQIENRYPETDVAARIASLKPELQRQLRERKAEDIFSELMELSPESDFEKILSQADQLRRNYNDTELFGKIQADLGEKERKARASSWRFKTEENMKAGRMRGALAQLESAARENPDLLYDLRDLCVELYQSVAATLMEEGDARQALTYYQRADRLLQAAGGEEKIDPAVLAELHNSVGQADFERREYGSARLHLSSAAWNYRDNAQFNMRLGAASLYAGLYQPAEKSLARALEIRTDMSPALLYRTYMNLRVMMSQERVLAGLFESGGGSVFIEQEPADDDDESGSGNNTMMSISIESEDGSNGDVMITSSTANSDEYAMNSVSAVDVNYNSAGESWFSAFAAGANGDSAVPNPRDINLFLDFDYNGSVELLPTMLDFLQELKLQSDEREAARKRGDVAVSQNRASRSDMRQAGRIELRLSEERNVSELHEQLRELRTVHLEDISARQELCEMIDEMKQRLQDAMADMERAGASQPQVLSLTEHVRAQVAEKYEQLCAADELIRSWAKSEVIMRDEMLKLAEKMLQRDDNVYGKRVDRLREDLFEANNAVTIDQALRALRDSMDVNVDLKNILSAAEGNVETAGAGL